MNAHRVHHVHRPNILVKSDISTDQIPVKSDISTDQIPVKSDISFSHDKFISKLGDAVKEKKKSKKNGSEKGLNKGSGVLSGTSGDNPFLGNDKDLRGDKKTLLFCKWDSCFDCTTRSLSSLHG